MPDWSQMTCSQVTQWFSAKLADVVGRGMVGDFTFAGILWEYNFAMAQAKS